MPEQNKSPVARILIIDDTLSIHEAFRKILAPGPSPEKELQEIQAALFDEPLVTRPRSQFEVDSAFSGMDGLQLVCRSISDERPYAVVFVDMCMPPGWNGLYTVRRIWEKCPEMNMVICTAYSEHSWETIAEQLGDIENFLILRKPFEREEVLQLAHMLSSKWRRALRKSQGGTPSPAMSASNSDQFRILMLEDESVTRAILTKKLTEHFPEAALLVAKTVAEAKALSVQGHIDFFLLDIFLPDGTGIDFMLDVMSRQPDVQVVLMTAHSLGEYRLIADQLGVLRFLEKPVNVPQLVGLIQPLIDAKPPDKHGDKPSFAATLNQLTSLDIIQLKCLGQASTQLAFTRTDGTQGRVWFDRGEVVHAEAPGKSGEAAFAEIVGWQGGRADEARGGKCPKQTITIPWQVLLLNTARDLDENHVAPGITRIAPDSQPVKS